jgi:hypothetical protein
MGGIETTLHILLRTLVNLRRPFHYPESLDSHAFASGSPCKRQIVMALTLLETLGESQRVQIYSSSVQDPSWISGTVLLLLLLPMMLLFMLMVKLEVVVGYVVVVVVVVVVVAATAATGGGDTKEQPMQQR